MLLPIATHLLPDGLGKSPVFDRGQDTVMIGIRLIEQGQLWRDNLDWKARQSG